MLRVMSIGVAALCACEARSVSLDENGAREPAPVDGPERDAPRDAGSRDVAVLDASDSAAGHPSDASDLPLDASIETAVDAAPADGAPDAEQGCGDAICQAAAGEDCTTCATDCGDCPFCGDRVCGAAESCGSCADDCCPACCDCVACCCDCVCDPGLGEDCQSCESDCGVCFCGNGTCDPAESCASCAVDCGPC